MKHIIALSRLIRFPNLLIIAGTQVLLRQCIILPFLKLNHMELQLAGGLFVLLVLATVLIAAGGYAINDYFDRKIDQVNKPNAVIVGRLIYPRHAMAYHLFFSITGILLGSWVSFRTGLFFLSMVFIMVGGLLWFYSTTYKREFFIGNIIVALLTALVPFMVLLFELPLLARTYGRSVDDLARYLLIWVLGFSTFAFLLNLCREIVKDAADFEGDQAYGKNTFPVVLGMRITRWIAILILIIVIVSLAMAWYFFVPDRTTLLYFMLGLILPLLAVIFLLARSENQESFKVIGLVLKLIMLAGLAYMIVVNLIIHKLT
jgi:4-hydroxybenzoate polyprenyltransferase